MAEPGSEPSSSWLQNVCPLYSVHCLTSTSFSLVPCPITDDVTVTECSHILFPWSSSPLMSLKYLTFFYFHEWSLDTITENSPGHSHFFGKFTVLSHICTFSPSKVLSFVLCTLFSTLVLDNMFALSFSSVPSFG